MFREWSFRVQGVLIDWLYARGVQRNMFFLELLARVWPFAFQAIFRCECGRHNTFFLFSPPEEEEGSPADDPDWWRPTFVEIGEIIERSPSPMGYDEYEIEVMRLGPMPGETNGVLSTDLVYLKETHPSRPVVEARGLFGDRYHDWYHGDGKACLEDLLRWSDPSPEAPLTVIQVMCLG
jgi:hypothetical protein